MLKLIFTLDYEIHGNGDGHPSELMTEPTARLMDLLDAYGAKLVIFADVGEILKFKEYYEQNGRDAYAYRAIVSQLREALQRGHDVQLHIHSSYFGSRYESGKWQQNWKKYNLAGLKRQEVYSIVRTCKNFLEETLKPAKADYDCYVFRAANWSMHPSPNIIDALSQNGIRIDTSVYKYGKQKGWVDYDYSQAYDATFPYVASREDISNFDPDGAIWEFPIHCELKPLPAFISPIRMFRALRALKHKHGRSYENNEQGRNSGQPAAGRLSRYIDALRSSHPRKFDFNQLTARQMINTLKKIQNEKQGVDYVTLIGHSKSFIRFNELTLRPFLEFVCRNREQYAFSLFPSREELKRL